jgi:regulator of replication initiation timing
MIVKNENKIVMSCRVSAALKDCLEYEAQEFGITLSTYLETLLSQREAVGQLETFAEENKRLRYENEHLHQKNAQQEAYIKTAEQYQIWYEPIHDTICKQSEELQKHCGKTDWRKPMLYAMATCIANEKSSFQVFTMRDFLDRNPKFISSTLKLNL